MNKIFKSKWNARLGAWVAVSEIAAAHGKRNRLRRNAALTLALTGALFQMSGAKAACGDSVTSVFATGGSTCSGQLTSYAGANVAYAIGSGSTLTFTAPSVTVNGNNRASTRAMESGGVNWGGTTPQPGATIHALGNLTVYEARVSTRGVFTLMEALMLPATRTRSLLTAISLLCDWERRVVALPSKTRAA